jgi:16S rRNA (cytosine967-C5)-methyltransferase
MAEHAAGPNAFELRIARQALLEWMRTKSPIDRVLFETFKEHHVGSLQRASISNALYRVMRFWGTFFLKTPNPENQASLRAIEEKLKSAFEITNERLLVEHAKIKPSFDGDILRHIEKVHGLPSFLMHEISARPAAWHLYLHQMLESEAPLTVRLNGLRAPAPQILSALAEFAPEPSAWVPGAYHLDRRVPLHSHAAFKDGLVEIQDEHSQLVSLLADPKPHERVLDLCAGAGGKSLHMASLMQGKGEILSYDLSKKKLAELGLRARRGGFTNIRVIETLPVRAQFDLVLVDAPCSGLGTLRRSPDRLFRFTELEARQLQTVQSELLERAHSLVKPGGRLVYATCTVRPAENVAMLARLVEAKKLQWSPIAKALTHVMGAKAAEFLTLARRTPAAQIIESPERPLPEGCLQLGPSTSQTSGAMFGDGFFVGLVNY